MNIKVTEFDRTRQTLLKNYRNKKPRNFKLLGFLFYNKFFV